MDDVKEALNPRQEDILVEVLGFTREIIGEEWVEETSFDENTSFTDDLSIESIELVALAEEIHRHFGEDVNLAAWFAQFDLNEVLLLTLGDLVRHIDESLQEGRVS